MYRVQAQYSVCQLFHWYIWLLFFLFFFLSLRFRSNFKRSRDLFVRLFFKWEVTFENNPNRSVTIAVRLSTPHVSQLYIYACVSQVFLCDWLRCFSYHVLAICWACARERRVGWQTRLRVYPHIYCLFFFPSVFSLSLSFSLHLSSSSGQAKCPKPRIFFFVCLTILSVYAFPFFLSLFVFVPRFRFFLVSTSVSRDFGATVVYPCHNSQSEGATSPRKRVLFFIYSPVTVKTHLKMAIPPCQVCRHNRPSFVVCSSSRRFFLAAILVFVSSIFFFVNQFSKST